MNKKVLDFVKKVEVRGIILSGIVEDSAYNVADQIMESKYDHLELIEDIEFLLDNDIEFFLFERLFGLSNSIKRACLDVINNYRFTYKDNLDLCNRVIGKINTIELISIDGKEEALVEYYSNDMLSRGLVFYNPIIYLEALFYDYYVYNSIINDEIDTIDYYDAVVSTTNYFLHNVPQIYFDKKFYENSMVLLNESIKNSHVFSGLKKNAKLTKKKLLEKNKNTE